MTRNEAKEIALKSIEEEIEKNGENHIFIAAPQLGKNSWTLKECKEAILNDKPLENSDNNLIDGIINLDKYLIEHNLKSLTENNE